MTAPCRVLVVDDDESIRNLLCTVLRRRDLVVDTARDGGEALQKIDAQRYRVLLLDLMMPQLDGYGFLRMLASRPVEQRPVVLVITASDDHELRKLDRHTVSGIVRKPFDIFEVADLVQACAKLDGRPDDNAIVGAPVDLGVALQGRMPITQPPEPLPAIPLEAPAPGADSAIPTDEEEL